MTMLTLTVESARRIYERWMQPDYKAMVRTKLETTTQICDDCKQPFYATIHHTGLCESCDL